LAAAHFDPIRGSGVSPLLIPSQYYNPLMTIPRVTSEKPSVPTLWVDTSVVIKLTKITRGETLQAVEIERLTRLQELVRKLGESGRLLCPRADQEEEYVAGRLEKDVHGDFLVLSLGVALRHRQGIFDHQVQLGMKAYVQQSDAITVPLLAYFHSDPVKELEEARQRSMLIGVNPFKDSEILARRSAAKAEVQRVWENLRQEFVAEKRSYEAQLREEQRGYADFRAVVTLNGGGKLLQRLGAFFGLRAIGVLPCASSDAGQRRRVWP
jgi:hypothetical protein